MLSRSVFSLGSCHVACPGITVSCIREQRRFITRLYTSYYAGQLFPNQLVRPKQRLPAGVSLAAARKNGCDEQMPHGSHTDAKGGVVGVDWADVDSTDLVNANAETLLASLNPPAVTRPYVPLGEAAKLELQGDYLTEGGLHQEALEHYGVVAKVYQLAYPEHHSQQVGIGIKLAGAFRRTGRLESSKANANRCVRMLDASPQPSLELIVEALLELGLSKEALKENDAGEVFEEAFLLADKYHNIGESHRMLRLLPRLGRRFNLNYEQKFIYFSPFDYDRTFTLVDQCMARAEEFYRRNQNTQGVVRVLQWRKEMMDRKFFNMRDFAGRIHTMRGHWKRRAGVLTDAPTPDELLRYSPTVHQVYRDFKYELNAPIGRESEVQEGVNRVVQDLGNPYRRRGHKSNQMLRDANYNFAKYVRQKEFGAQQ